MHLWMPSYNMHISNLTRSKILQLWLPAIELPSRPKFEPINMHMLMPTRYIMPSWSICKPKHMLMWMPLTMSYRSDSKSYNLYLQRQLYS